MRSMNVLISTQNMLNTDTKWVHKPGKATWPTSESITIHTNKGKGVFQHQALTHTDS